MSGPLHEITQLISNPHYELVSINIYMSWVSEKGKKMLKEYGYTYRVGFRRGWSIVGYHVGGYLKQPGFGEILSVIHVIRFWYRFGVWRYLHCVILSNR